MELAPDMGVNVAEGGYVILSGILNQQADDVVAAYEAQGFGVTGRDELGDWTTLVLRK